jgi:predicted DNA-binding ribbon-helix-helix protein
MIRKRSVLVSGHKTSISLEEPFWAALQSLADRRGVSVNLLVAEIDAGRDGNLSSALRVYVLAACRRGELAPGGS